VGYSRVQEGMEEDGRRYEGHCITPSQLGKGEGISNQVKGSCLKLNDVKSCSSRSPSLRITVLYSQSDL